AARFGDAPTDLIRKTAREETRIERSECLALEFDDHREAIAQHDDIGRLFDEFCVFDAVGIDADALLRRRPRADRDDIFRAHRPARVLAQAFEQSLALIFAV